MRRVLLMWALIMPIIVSSCSDDKEDEYDYGIIKKEQILGTWLIEPGNGKYSHVELKFKSDDYFTLIEIAEWIADDGDIVHSQRETEGHYTVENNTITFGNNYFQIVRSLKDTILEGKIDFGYGAHYVTARKQ